MLEMFFLTALATYALSFIFRTFPYLEFLRNFISENISSKLVECVFCQSFWLSPIVLSSIGISFGIHYILFMLSIASFNFFLENIVFKE